MSKYIKPIRRILNKQSIYLQYDKGYNHSHDEWEAYHKEINSELLEYSKKVMALLDKLGGSIVPHLLDTDENDGEFLRQAIIKAEEAI